MAAASHGMHNAWRSSPIAVEQTDRDPRLEKEGDVSLKEKTQQGLAKQGAGGSLEGEHLQARGAGGTLVNRHP